MKTFTFSPNITGKIICAIASLGLIILAIFSIKHLPWIIIVAFSLLGLLLFAQLFYRCTLEIDRNYFVVSKTSIVLYYKNQFEISTTDIFIKEINRTVDLAGGTMFGVILKDAKKNIMITDFNKKEEAEKLIKEIKESLTSRLG
jgi:hypothetical protein